VLFLFVRDSCSFQNSIFYLLHYQREALSLSVLFKHYFGWIWGCTRIYYLLTWNLVAARSVTFLNTSLETVSVRYNCCTTLAVSDPVLNQRSVRPRCSVSDMSDTIVSFNALPNFSLISVRRSLNTSASAWQIFLVSVIPDPHSLHFYCIALCCHGFTVCTTPLPRHSRRCLQKPSLLKALLRVHVGAKANVHYPRSCIVQDALFSVSEKLGSVCVSFETESQYTFLYRHSTDFGTLFPTVSYNPLSRQSTVPTHITLCPTDPRYFSAVSMNQLYISVQTTALPVNGVTDRRFRRERSHSYIFLLTISATSLYCLF